MDKVTESKTYRPVYSSNIIGRICNCSYDSPSDPQDKDGVLVLESEGTCKASGSMSYTDSDGCGTGVSFDSTGTYKITEEKILIELSSKEKKVNLIGKVSTDMKNIEFEGTGDKEGEIIGFNRWILYK
mmetsp:Transcript_56949/g.65243  ORF Transcript_56949/g.65243 Transcript_56949/m.65243 type:complete len:128 (+) Transcript_56949:19-402(+)|eukprot:CAMPEP_0176428364 /NCGR_PEP_ID=MMETSP0127-20121128/13107_1 /TAXON_ID=938130 /ORGANISM="Platyophrya macrostoma, Strain WH" /LENGTH=127 /DNA_ID=CAMNT_0017810035 /DNA_START=17 /DNA_END=400 /DNA_ORIENTATION=-